MVLQLGLRLRCSPYIMMGAYEETLAFGLKECSERQYFVRSGSLLSDDMIEANNDKGIESGEKLVRDQLLRGPIVAFIERDVVAGALRAESPKGYEVALNYVLQESIDTLSSDIR